MAKECSFDIVSEYNKQELVNAIDQVKRELTSRFDLKNSNSEVDLEADKSVTITTNDEMKLKNIIDRLLPLATMHLRFKNGQMRHYPRYKKQYKMGLLYKGNGKQEFLEKWLERVMINLEGTSIGTFHIENEGEILNALIND